MTGTTGMTAFVAPGVPSDKSKSRRFHMRLMAALVFAVTEFQILTNT